MFSVERSSSSVSYLFIASTKTSTSKKVSSKNSGNPSMYQLIEKSVKVVVHFLFSWVDSWCELIHQLTQGIGMGFIDGTE